MMSPMPLVPRVSVLMPVLNGGRFLAAAVESILNQTSRNLELIAIDDGSTDQSVALLSRLAGV
jgi:glycosyltransferase involved in cell wall biosynthesis